MFFKDLERYFEKVAEVDKNWKQYRKDFCLDFWFQNIIVRRNYLKQVAEGKITQEGLNTFTEYTQKEEVSLESELRQATQRKSGARDTRLVTLKSIEQYIVYSSFLAQLMFKILFIADIERYDKISCSKDLLKTLFRMIEL